jgi:hypothetical protein
MNVLRRLLLASALVFGLGGLVTGCASDEGDRPTPADASLATQDAGTAALGYMEACTDNAQCMSNLCFNFNSKGPHCTHECTTATDCEEPSPGCNGMGVCKVP